MQRNSHRHLLTHPQLFKRIGKDRFVILENPEPGIPVYIWDESKQRIVLKTTS